MRVGCLLLLLATSCSFDPSGLPGSGDADPADDGNANNDGNVDGDGGNTDATVGPDAEQLAGLDLSGGDYVYDTNSESFTVSANPVTDPLTMQRDQAGLPALVIRVGSFRLRSDSNLRVVGDRPLIVESMGTIDIEGILDVSSGALGRGAGANPSTCGAQRGEIGMDDANSGGSPGGGGGALGGAGGQGGTGDTNDTTNPTAGGSGGTALAPAPAIVRGGCPGGNGGTDDGPPGEGGGGGGAINLIAAGTLTVTGTIHAGGEGGTGADSATNSGGGGGGSGGLIRLDAPTVAVSGTLAANGGGGGEAARVQAQTPVDGEHATASATPALGGAGGVDNPQGGDGGNGGAVAVAGLMGGPGLGGGGGGGGGSGFILVFTSSIEINGSTISPALMQP